MAVFCSALFTSEDFIRWRGSFYDRLKQHVAAASKSLGEHRVNLPEQMSTAYSGITPCASWRVCQSHGAVPRCDCLTVIKFVLATCCGCIS
jgi:hypothetical protein